MPSWSFPSAELGARRKPAVDFSSHDMALCLARPPARSAGRVVVVVVAVTRANNNGQQEMPARGGVRVRGCSRICYAHKATSAPAAYGAPAANKAWSTTRRSRSGRASCCLPAADQALNSMLAASNPGARGRACTVAGTRLGGSSVLAANPVPNGKQEPLHQK